jgi:hypothetical protein
VKVSAKTFMAQIKGGRRNITMRDLMTPVATADEQTLYDALYQELTQGSKQPNWRLFAWKWHAAYTAALQQGLPLQLYPKTVVQLQQYAADRVEALYERDSALLLAAMQEHIARATAATELGSAAVTGDGQHTTAQAAPLVKVQLQQPNAQPQRKKPGPKPGTKNQTTTHHACKKAGFPHEHHYKCCPNGLK